MSVLCIKCKKYEIFIDQIEELIRLQEKPPEEDCVVDYFKVEAQWETIMETLKQLKQT